MEIQNKKKERERGKDKTVSTVKGSKGTGQKIKTIWDAKIRGIKLIDVSQYFGGHILNNLVCKFERMVNFFLYYVNIYW